jgi:hypothetical protein
MSSQTGAIRKTTRNAAKSSGVQEQKTASLTKPAKKMLSARLKAKKEKLRRRKHNVIDFGIIKQTIS